VLADPVLAAGPAAVPQFQVGPGRQRTLPHGFRVPFRSSADGGLTTDAELMGVLLGWSPRIDIGRISAESGLSPERTVLALTRLAASGRVGYDLQCSGQTGGVFSDDGTVLGQIRDGDGLDTLIRWADEHRPRCEWARCPADERERPELTVEKRAEVHLKWSQGYWAEKDFAVLHRLDYQVWDAWRQPSHLEGRRVIGEPPVLLTRDGVSYEMALAAVFRAMGDEMLEEFGVVSL
jgi:hypothetical protein